MKHAFMIVAHKQDYTLQTLLTLLDHRDHDIFLHMDAKNKAFQPRPLQELVRRGRLFCVPRIKVTWGGGIVRFGRSCCC